jgi:CheY-like chemotaxis protein
MMEPGSPVSVLVVEDDEGLRALFTTLLTRHGFQNECVNDGAQALDRLARASFSVVLLDLMMTVKNCYDVLSAFADTRPALLRRTIITTGVSERDLSKIDRAGVFAVLRKPFDIDVLITTIRSCALQGGGRGPSGDGGGGTLDAAARKLEAALPHLRRMFADDVGCDQELLLRHELRRVMDKLGGVLAVAAAVEVDATRAKRYERLGRAASRLAHDDRHTARMDPSSS